MKKKIYALSLTIALTLGLAVFISGFSTRSAASASDNAANALPASDVVVTIDTQRLMAETLPTIFADKPALLAKVNTKIEQFNKETGIDLRTFDSVAVGLRFTTPSSKDFEAVVVARGHFNSNEVIDAAFAAAKRKNEFQKTEEQYEGKTIYVVTPQRRGGNVPANTEVVVNSNGADVNVSVATTPEAKNDSSRAKPAARVVAGGPQLTIGETRRTHEQMAIVALDATTLAFGELKGVRAAIDANMGRGRVDDALVRMATQNASALIGFSGKIPPSMTEKLAGGKGIEAKYFASIREFYGSFGTIGADAEVFIAARTENAGQATDISQALNALKLLGGFSFAQPSKSEARSLAGLLKELSITSQDNEVQIKMNIKQKDLAPFMREF